MREIDPLENEIDAWMKDFAAADLSRKLPDANSLWIKAKLIQTTAAMERAGRPITRAQIVAYLVVGGGWAALVTWKWNAVLIWINGFRPTHIILDAAGVQTAQSLSLTLLMSLIVLASLTVVLAFHTILAEE
jgi:hypothetical protein